MKTKSITLAMAVFVAAPLAAQSTTGMAQSTTAVKVENKVNPTLAASVKVSADSALGLARSHADWGEVSSAKLEMEDKRLVYNITLLNKSKRATRVAVDAMSGEVVADKKLGGLNAAVTHAKENKKLLNAKRDSAAKSP
jgi:uncharacterized membrane protein YkoI